MRLKQLVYNKSLILIERSLYELLHLLLRGHYSNKDSAYCYERNDGDFTRIRKNDFPATWRCVSDIRNPL